MSLISCNSLKALFKLECQNSALYLNTIPLISLVTIPLDVLCIHFVLLCTNKYSINHLLYCTFW